MGWQKENADILENKIREQLPKDLAGKEYLKIMEDLGLQPDCLIIAGYDGGYNPKRPYHAKLPNGELGSIKIINYDSLFKTIYEENNKAIASSSWWTEAICKTENAIVLGDVSFKG